MFRLELPPSQWRWIGPAPASCLLFGLFGLVYGNGVFVAFIDDPDFTRAVGVLVFCTALGITVFGVLLHSFQGGAQRLALLAGCLLLGQSAMAVALRLRLRGLLYAGAAAVGLGSGCGYMVALATIQAWFPGAPGTATGASMLFASSGSLVGSFTYRLAALRLGPVDAMLRAGFAAAALTLLAATAVSRPPPDWERDAGVAAAILPSYRPIEDDRDSLLSSPGAFSPFLLPPTGPRLSLAHVLRPDRAVGADAPPLARPLSLGGGPPRFCADDPLRVQHAPTEAFGLGELARIWELYPFLLAAGAAMSPGTGVVLGFGSMLSVLFGMHPEHGSAWVVRVTFASIAGRLLTGVAVDHLDDRAADPSGLIGARRVMRALLYAQLLALLSMPLWARMGSRVLFVASTSIIYFAFSGGPVASACLSRAIFAPVNFTLAFSVSTLLVSATDLVFAMLVATPSLAGNFSRQYLHAFDNYFKGAIGMTAVGAVAAVFLSVSQTAYDRAFPYIRQPAYRYRSMNSELDMPASQS